MLNGPQQEKLQCALIDAFPSRQSLEQMLFHKLNRNLNEVTGEKDLKTVVFSLIKAADSQGWVKDLVDAACKENPGNVELKTIAPTILQILKKNNLAFENRKSRIGSGVEQSDFQFSFSDIELSPSQVLLPIENHQLLFDLLLNLDFEEQFDLVYRVVKTHKIGGFLVHGEPDCGQELLVSKLYRVTRGWQNSKLILIDFTSAACKIENLWERVASFFHCPPNPDPDMIRQRVCECWQTQDVIFIFSKVEAMISTKALSQWLQEFWKPLVARAAQNLRGKETETHLLMFLVNYYAQVDTASDSLFLNQYLEQDSKYPYVPLCLPPVSSFPENTLEQWLSKTVPRFSQIQIPPSLTSSILFQNSNKGNPRMVCQEICKHYGLSWEKKLAGYLKIKL